MPANFPLRDFPDLQAALIEANVAARAIVRRIGVGRSDPWHGSIDVENEQRQPIARILLADVARQMS
ncbi:hypothetical protein IAG41_22680 [Sphingomonas sp. JC676]|nr:hypothetical protein [Sphingomonas sp. JC676]